jgi:hypothetical protein
MTIPVDNEVLAKIIDQLNTIDDLPCPISLKELSETGPALLAKQVGGTVTNQTNPGSIYIYMQS